MKQREGTGYDIAQHSLLTFITSFENNSTHAHENKHTKKLDQHFIPRIPQPSSPLPLYRFHLTYSLPTSRFPFSLLFYVVASTSVPFSLSVSSVVKFVFLPFSYPQNLVISSLLQCLFPSIPGPQSLLLFSFSSLNKRPTFRFDSPCYRLSLVQNPLNLAHFPHYL